MQQKYQARARDYKQQHMVPYESGSGDDDGINDQHREVHQEGAYEDAARRLEQDKICC